jgi:membrane-associated phospholipid phosphatase
LRLRSEQLALPEEPSATDFDDWFALEKRLNVASGARRYSDLSDMSVDQFLKWSFIAIVATIDLILLSFCNLELQWSDLLVPAVLGMLLVALSLYYHRNQGETLVLCMVTLVQMGSYTTVVAVLIYLVTSLNFPMADPWLQSIDRLVGFSPQAVVEWTRSMPLINHVSTWAYLFIVPETLLTILAIAFLNKRILLEQFTCQFMIGTGICAITGCFLPAAGPAYNHGIAPADWQLPYIDHFLALRSGETYLFSWRNTEGLVTFPSFHTAWAVMLILVWRQQSKMLFLPVCVLSVLIILSTLTTASHYSIDIVGGLLLAGFCWWASEKVTAFAYDAKGQPRRIDLPVFLGVSLTPASNRDPVA